MDQTAADQATTAQADQAGAPAPELTPAQQLQADRQALEAVLAGLGEHPYMPAELRQVWPAVLNMLSRRDREHAEVLRVLDTLQGTVNDLIASLSTAKPANGG